MADIDLLPARGIRGYAVVADTGIAVGGTLTVLQLAQRGMRSICAVNSDGTSSGGLTMLQLGARGIMGCCSVLETGLSTDSAVPILILKQRGLNPMCPVTALGVAQGGSATMIQLAQRGIQGFCPLTEAGAETTFSGTAFSGPGDVVSGALSWYGLRAYSNATKGASLVRIRRVSDNAEQDFASLSTGALDRASIVTFLAATTGRFVTFYDQITTRHVTQATAANQAVVNLSGIGSLVTADFTAASTHSYASAGTLTQAQPFTWNGFAKSVNNGGAQTLFIADDSFGSISFRSPGDNTAFAYAGTVLSATAADGSFHALTAVHNGASSDMNVDGTTTSGNAGASGPGGALIQLGQFNGTQFFNGSFCEGGIWVAVFSGAQSSSMSTNQHAYWDS